MKARSDSSVRRANTFLSFVNSRCIFDNLRSSGYKCHCPGRLGANLDGYLYATARVLEFNVLLAGQDLPSQSTTSSHNFRLESLDVHC